MKIKLKILLPNSVFFDNEVEKINIKLLTGYITILPEHTPMISIILPSPLNINIDGKIHSFAIFGGFINVTKDYIIISTHEIEKKESIDFERAKRAKTRALEYLEHPQEKDIERAKNAIARADVRLALFEKGE